MADNNTIMKQRVEYLDMLKCIGMFIVVSGHIHPSYGWFSLPLHSYVIPLYFLLSGMTFRRTKFPTIGSFIKHRAQTLILPYFLFSIVTWILWAMLILIRHDEANIWNPLLQTLISQGSGAYMLHNPPLWFVPCLFIIEILYYYLDQLPEKITAISCIICASIGVYMIVGKQSGFFTKLPWSIEGAFASVIFYCVGNIITHHLSLSEIESLVLKRKGLAVILICILTPILVISAHWNGHVSIGSDLLGKSPILFYINAFIGIVTIFLYSILICHFANGKRLIEPLHKYKLWLGRNSFYIMAIHFPVKKVLMLAISMAIGKSVYEISNDYISCALVFAATYVISSLLAIVVVKMKKRDSEALLRIKMKFEKAYEQK